MGLDQFLSKKVYLGLNYKHNRVENAKNIIQINNIEYTTESLQYLEYEAGYWRKANHIHNYFVSNVQDGNDDCGSYEVSFEILKNLYNMCKEVLKDKTKAEELLPTEGGFFFGSTEYEEYYFKTLEETIKIIEPLLKEDCEIYYTSSW